MQHLLENPNVPAVFKEDNKECLFEEVLEDGSVILAKVAHGPYQVLVLDH